MPQSSFPPCDASSPSPEVAINTVVSITAAATPGRSASHAALEDLAVAAAGARGDLEAALALASAWGTRLPRPGRGDTATLWAALATVGAIDLQLARVLEPHVDALAILDELDGRVPDEQSTWGVFAAEAPGLGLEATRADASGDAWELHGDKPWCSLADRLSHALVTAWTGESRGLFSVALTDPRVSGGDQPWVARGLPSIRSTSIHLDRVPATQVGDAGWYLRRDGFAWGGMGVAAVWYGGAVGVARRLARQAEQRQLDQIGHLHLGAVDIALHQSRAVLAEAATLIDAGHASGGRGAQLAWRVRSVVAQTVEVVQRHADHALGPAPLVAEDDYAARVADLHLYVRQHHAERDVAALGKTLVEQPQW